MGKRTGRPVVVQQGFEAEAKQREELARLHTKSAEPEPPAKAPRVRWIVPRAYGRPIAHAYLEGAARTLCGGIPTAGAVYPPSEGLQRCPECLAGAKRHEATAPVLEPLPLVENRTREQMIEDGDLEEEVQRDEEEDPA